MSTNKFKKFKVGDVVRCVSSDYSYITLGRTYVIKEIQDGWYRVITDNGLLDGYGEGAFELVDLNPVLTPEEVFEHLRKGTKLQRLISGYGWVAVETPNILFYREICSQNFRVKPEPEIITLNGKRYQALED